MINWQFFPKSDSLPDHLKKVVLVFENKELNISSSVHELASNEVLSHLSEGFEAIGYAVEKSKKQKDKIHVPVLFGRNGSLEKYFEADCLNTETKTVMEVEAGRAVTNNQFLKDLFQASVMHDIEYLIVAVRNTYRKNKDFEKVISFLESLYASNRLQLPLNGILIIGY